MVITDMRFQDEFTLAIKIRLFEETLLELFSDGKLNGTVHTCIGQEFIPVFISKYLTAEDMVFSNHRGHGHYLAKTENYDGLLREVLGCSTGLAGGIGGSQHLFDDQFISNGIQGGLAPISCGWAYHNKLVNSDGIAVCYLGDGTLGEGQLYEAIMLAAMHKTRVLFVLEDNGYAQSTPSEISQFGNVESRITGFGLSYMAANIWDLSDLDTVCQDAINTVRNDCPTVLHIGCYRLKAHSKGDDNRATSEIQSYIAKDPINKFKTTQPVLYEEIRGEFVNYLNEIASRKLISNFNRSVLQGRDDKISDEEFRIVEEENLDSVRVNKQINNALHDAFNENEFIIIGEDILDKTLKTPHQYGGAFKVTEGLSSNYPSRVLASTISEAGIIGFATGIALSGGKGIAEIMFGDFMTLTVDQIIQQVSKIPGMFGQSVDLPILVRTPMGARRGYGPTHSQNIERIFLNWPNVEVVSINRFFNCYEFYLKLLSSLKQPHLIFEDKVTYTKYQSAEVPPGYCKKISVGTYPIIKFEPKNLRPNITIISYGGMCDIVYEAVAELMLEDIFPVLLFVSNLNSDYSLLFRENIERQPLLIVEEGGVKCSWGSEFVASAVQNGIQLGSVARLGNNEIIACSRELESQQIPSARTVVDVVKELIND